MVIFEVKKSISRSNNEKSHFQQIKLGTCEIPLFHAILSEKSIYGNILLIPNHLQCQEVILKVKNKMAARYFKVKYDFQTYKARNKCNTSCSYNFD